MIEYTLKRTKRRTIGLEVRPDGSVIVRAPLRLSQRNIDLFLKQHEDWILKHQAIAEQKRANMPQVPKLTEEEHAALVKAAKAYIPQRVAHYAPLVGVSYGRISIRSQKTRWGSCSSKGNLNFNCMLMLAPKEVIDSIVVHELCHRKEMNHSARFYAEIDKVFPEYRKWNRWLKENGSAILSRLP